MLGFDIVFAEPDDSSSLGVLKRLGRGWQAALQRYSAAALQRCRAQDWDAAEAAMAALMERYPQCGLYAVYRRRIAALRRALLPADWDGVNTFDSK